jgi:hypothetical protein
LIGLLLDKAVKIKGINPMIILFERNIKLLKILAVNTMQASELGTVAISDNRQQHSRQLQWAQSKPSLIAMDVIDAIIVKRQSAHETSILLMRQREQWQSHKVALPTKATKAL